MALTDNLVSVWAQDEASGNALDSVGSNVLTDANTVGAASGKLSGSRLYARANSESFSITHNSTMAYGFVNFAFAFWFKFTSKPASNSIMISRGTTGDGELYVYLDQAADRVKFLVCGSTSFGSQGTITAANFGAPSTGVWYFGVAWHDSTNGKLGISINDVAETDVTHTAGVLQSTGLFTLGRSAFGDYFDGELDEVSFRKGSIYSSSERTELYNGGTGLAWPYSGGAPAAARRLGLLGIGV